MQNVVWMSIDYSKRKDSGVFGPFDYHLIHGQRNKIEKMVITIPVSGMRKRIKLQFRKLETNTAPQKKLQGDSKKCTMT